MSDHDDEFDFPVIKTVILGKLPDSLMSDWQALQLKTTRLEEAYEAVKKVTIAFRTIVCEAVKIPRHPDGEPVSFNISPEGEVSRAGCTCPVCQAKQHKMSVSEVVEKMHAITPFSPELLAAFQLRARLVDAQMEAETSNVH